MSAGLRAPVVSERRSSTPSYCCGDEAAQRRGRAQRWLTTEQVQQLVTEYEGGASIKQLAARSASRACRTHC